VEFFKLQKEYSFNKTMVLQTTIFVASKHTVAFKKAKYFIKHSISQTLQYFASKQRQVWYV